MIDGSEKRKRQFDMMLWRHVAHKKLCPLQLSPPRRPLCIIGRAGEREKESARGMMGRGKRKSSRLFPLPIVPRAISIFRLLLFLLGCLAGASAEERAFTSILFANVKFKST